LNPAAQAEDPSLGLAIVPTHPDRSGGLGFLDRLATPFAPVVLAAGTVLASRWAHDAVYHGLAMQSVRVEMAAFIVACVLLFTLPPRSCRCLPRWPSRCR